MKKKYKIILYIIVAFIIFTANASLINKVYLQDVSAKAELRKVINPTNSEILTIIEPYFTGNNLEIKNAIWEENKRFIYDNDVLVGYAFVIIEKIGCPTCSEVNFLFVTDSEYNIYQIIYLRDIVEDNKIIPVEKFQEFSKKFLNKNLYDYDFEKIKRMKFAPKHTLST